jgi:hypothetical protein
LIEAAAITSANPSGACPWLAQLLITLSLMCPQDWDGMVKRSIDGHNSFAFLNDGSFYECPAALLQAPCTGHFPFRRGGYGSCFSVC